MSFRPRVPSALRLSRVTFLLSLIASLAVFAPRLSAQTVHFSGAVRTLGSGFYGPWDVALDKSGNVFVADSYNNLVKEIVAVNGRIPASPTVKTLGSGFSLPTGLALDRSGNVYGWTAD